MSEPLNVESFKERLENAMRMSWGVYNVYPHLEDALTLCDQYAGIRKERDRMQEVVDGIRSIIHGETGRTLDASLAKIRATIPESLAVESSSFGEPEG